MKTDPNAAHAGEARINTAHAGVARMLGWQRLLWVVSAALPIGLMVSENSSTPLQVWLLRTLIVSLLALLAFGMAEQWPRRLPRWLARWFAQLLAVAVAVPIGAVLAYLVTTGGDPQFASNPNRRTGLTMLIVFGLLFGTWLAFGALLRQREAAAQQQALAFQLERSELERRALDARLRLVQAQVQPHFLFNTLANVRALVNAGSPQAPLVLDSLIAYLRAATPRLGQTDSTLDAELQLVTAYLELMQMRMPDRLLYAVHAEPGARGLRCPPMTLLTLVENAVRHGIDPSEQGGRIEVDVALRDGRCCARVLDTGVGLQQGAAARGQGSSGLGTGLDSLRERLQLAFAGDARLRLSSLQPHGTRAEIEFPAQPASA
jgi:signal transduction histidine kinase